MKAVGRKPSGMNDKCETGRLAPCRLQYNHNFHVL